MKPRVTLEQQTQPDGSVLALIEHDGRHYLTVDGETTAGPATRASEEQMAAVACAPFRPVRQPKVWVTGLGLGSALRGVRSMLLQKRLTMVVAEPVTELAGWLRTHLDDHTFLEDDALQLTHDASADGLLDHRNSLHAVLLHADTAPQPTAAKPFYEDTRWLTAAFDALLDGGLIAIASARPIAGLERQLRKVGFDPILHEIDAAPNARRPRKHSLWLGRKGSYSS